METGDSFPISVLQEHRAQGKLNIVASKLCALGPSTGDPAAVLSTAHAQENWTLLLACRREVTHLCGTFGPGGRTRVHVSEGRQRSVTGNFPTVFTKYRVCFSPVTSGSWKVLGWWCRTSDVEGPGSFHLLAPPSWFVIFIFQEERWRSYLWTPPLPSRQEMALSFYSRSDILAMDFWAKLLGKNYVRWSSLAVWAPGTLNTACRGPPSL